MKNFKKILFTGALITIASLSNPITSAHAGHNADHKHEGPTLSYDESMIVEPGKAVIQVQGLVCKVCAAKAKKALNKLDFINSVDVDLKNQLITIDLKDGEKIDLDAVSKEIKAKGFNPYLAYSVDADGRTVIHKLQ
jgi:copper chaperone CopZ